MKVELWITSRVSGSRVAERMELFPVGYETFDTSIEALSVDGVLSSANNDERRLKIRLSDGLMVVCIKVSIPDDERENSGVVIGDDESSKKQISSIKTFVEETEKTASDASVMAETVLTACICVSERIENSRFAVKLHVCTSDE